MNLVRADQVTAARLSPWVTWPTENSTTGYRGLAVIRRRGQAPHAVNVGLQMREDSPAELAGSDGTVSS